nr:hypothetical protein [Tanacetum cinerariifolium]
MIDLSYQGCKPDTDTEKGSSWRCKDSSGRWKLRWLVLRLKVRNEKDFSYIECMLPLKYQQMVVTETSFPKMECSGGIVVKCSHLQYKFPLPVKVVATARRLEMPLPEVCTAIEEKKKKLPVKDRWQLH